ncbi:hypothetical protein ACXLRP_003114 [Acinetobacter baumannii]|uniref:hypothetical protein n=1 Tax=Acinetobacter baumannii TaxID=470 RepID=UPI000707AE9B|nr:hypothetical protein [Acinetobacter baumannii]EKT8029964.1 hypothetical protein [Acinetobacter baumannii]EKT8494580.1 hypothetical protein [Acinetobacter baumannii]EKT9774865.1 hypothetical protein [Acinetobacter baumannii]EKT9801784.1 hypothetical protein [Acinetobacter baumannii]EKU0469201.1 hypothetical protein [Acinetobacter baumannii]
MDKKALQEQFEAIAIQNCWNINKYPAGWDGRGDDEYADDFVSGAWWGFQHQQAKVEELQRRNQMLNDNIKEQGQKLVYQNEVIETQAEKLLGLRDEKAELQKRVDALSKRLSEATGLVVEELEQALKGDQYDEHRKKAEEAISEK